MNKINWSAVQLAWGALKAKKTRSILTILGISIGIAMVIAIMAAGRGLDYLIMGELEVFGSDTISIEVKVPSTKKNSNENASSQAQGVTITTLKDKDLEVVSKNPGIVAAYGYVMGQEVASYDGQNKTVMLIGEGYNVREVEKFAMEEGRMYTAEEQESSVQVAVLGWGVKNYFFSDNSALGQIVYIKGKPFRVVGVAAKRGAVFSMDMDNVILLPTKTMQKKILGTDYFQAIIGKLKDVNTADATVRELEEAIRINHKIDDPEKDDFAINTMAEAIGMLSSIVGGITLLLVALVCISLVVGGVGIMNIMYVSVTERVFEIGLRKALGAKSKDILWQFLSEAVILTVLGGLVGILLGLILALIIYAAATYYGLSWIYSVPISSIFLSVGFSAAVGLVFGLYPAKKAASLEPMTALRKE